MFAPIAVELAAAGQKGLAWLLWRRVALFLLVLLPACRGHAGADASAQDCSKPATVRTFGTCVPRHGPYELWLCSSTEPSTLDPARCNETVGAEIIENLFSGLTTLSPDTLEPVGDMATSWRLSADGRTYTFALRPSRWSDGVPVTAADFVFSIQRALQPATAAASAMLLYIIDGAQAFAEGTGSLSAVAVQALDPMTLQVRLRHPAPWFLQLAAHSVMRPVARHIVAAAEAAGDSHWLRAEHLVGNGAFRVAKWRFRRDFVLEKNPHYWDAAHVALQRVHVWFVESADTAMALYEHGDVDALGATVPVPTAWLPRVANTQDFSATPNLVTAFYWLNSRAAPLDDVRVRRALSLAIDREALVRNVLRGTQIPSADFVPDKLAGYQGLHLPLFDPNKARALLAEAGFDAERPMRPLRLAFNTGEDHRRMAEAIQAMWQAHLGIAVQLEQQEWRVYLQNIEQQQFDIARLGWVADYADPRTFLLDVLSAHSGNNLSGWQDAQVEAWLQQSERTADPQQRLALLRQAEARAMAAQPLLPLYVGTQTSLQKPYVHNMPHNALGTRPLRYVCLTGGCGAP